MNIFLLDNDSDRTTLIATVLGAAGHDCRAFADIDGLLAHLDREDIHMLLVDSQTSGARTVELLTTFKRGPTGAAPVLLLSDRQHETDIRTGLEAGANDYIIKPLRRGELLTRVNILLERAHPEEITSTRVQFAQYIFETRAGRLTNSEHTVAMTQKEFALAFLLFRNLGRPLSRAYIAEAIWPDAPELSSRTIDTHISRVRGKLGLRPENGFRLSPVYSYGYRLEQLPSSTVT